MVRVLKIRGYGSFVIQIALSVFEQNVIVRLILLDEVILQQESILLAIYYDVADISYVAY